jgi:hypothetical protein
MQEAWSGMDSFGSCSRGGLRIEVEPGFDADELRRLIAALDGVPLRNGLQQPV